VILTLNNPVRDYAWGSTTLLPDLLGTPPTGRPQAELWIGAHPAASSVVTGGPQAGTSLHELIAADPDHVLGADVAATYGPRLPFLLKVLAIAQPLSIQAHPSAAQAEEGYAAEDAAGVPTDAPHRSYRDPYHKPEMVVALSEFEALLGWSEPDIAADRLAGLEVDRLTSVVDGVRAGALSAALTELFALPEPEVGALVEAVTEAARRDPHLYDLVLRLAEFYPGDLGIVLALLLEPARLEPGQAVFVPDGVPHAYLSGLAVEVQASSDNTLRAGLTGKHGAPERLMRVLEFGPLAAVPVIAHEVSPGRVDYPVAGVEEFALSRVNPGEADVPLPADGPWSVLCVEGQVTVATDPDDGEDASSLSLGPGQAGFIPAGQHPSRVGGPGVAYVVTVPS